MKQELQVIRHWDKGLSHPKLILSGDSRRCQRLEYFEFYPVSVAKVLSWTCVGIFAVRCENQLRDFSVGVLCLQQYSYDHNLADCLGKIPESWALVQASSAQGAQFWSCGKLLASYPALRPGDSIGVYLDQNEPDDGERGCGSLHFLLNNRPLFSLRGLRRGVYGMASTMAPNSELSIIDDRSVAEALMCSAEKQQRKEEEEADDDLDVLPRNEARDSREDISDSIILHHNHTVPASTTTSTLLDSVVAADAASTHPATIPHSNASTAGLATARPGPIPVPAYFPSLPLLAPAPRAKPSPDATATTTMAIGQMECCICMSAAKTVVFMPCKHLCTCESCSQVEHCPICRLRIKSRMRVFT